MSAAGDRPVVILYGPTASGKSDVAVALAERIGGAVVNADSMQLYRELQILTARPSAADVARAPHRLYGVLSASEASSVAWWRARALGEIAAARAAGKVAIVVGGTGLYIKALIDGLSPVPASDAAARAAATARLDAIGGEAFRAELARRDPVIAARLKSGDRQRLIRAWEVVEATGVPLSAWQARPRQTGHDLSFRLVAMLPERDALYARIDRRFDAILRSGGLEEARSFFALDLPPTLPANKALGLRELGRHLAGEPTLDEAAALAKQASRNYAKRQMTWFRNQLPAPPEGKAHASHAVVTELSERKLAEIISFIVRPG